MKLTSVTVRNFRSYVACQGKPTRKLALADGLNLLVGPNNCGKSNLLRAISLALEDSGGTRFDPAHDLPSQLAWAYPVITLGFQCNRRVPVERTLVRFAREYEQSAGAHRTYAERGEVHFRVAYRSSGRDESFLVRGAPSKKGDPTKLGKTIAQFNKCIRFIHLRSGESLNHFMSGAFKELLHTVLQEQLSEQVELAKRHRDKYMHELMADLLNPLSKHATEQLGEVMAEIQEVAVRPFVPELEETLSKASIFIRDSAQTHLRHKGTGVRGALLVALLGYLARHSRRSLIFAVEEPESFLHPRAQQELRADLNTIAGRDDITLLATTHSPFMLDRSPTTRITPLSKDLDGRTGIGEPISGDSPHAPIVSHLFGEALTPSVLDSVQPLRDGVAGVLFVEGYTDKFYLESAARVAGRPELLDGLEIRYDEGAYKSAMQAIMLRQMVRENVPVAVLFDHDELGKKATDLLTTKFGWRRSMVPRYSRWHSSNSLQIEAEDMFPEPFLEKFVASQSPDALAEKVRLNNGGGFHYGFTQEGKAAFMRHVEEKLRARDTHVWISILEDIRKLLKLDGTDVRSGPPPARRPVDRRPASRLTTRLAERDGEPGSPATPQREGLA